MKLFDLVEGDEGVRERVGAVIALQLGVICAGKGRRK